ncbi:MAG: YidC/Oxa1 family membrane protein insertase [Clostridia bacterium]|nr:YidC/Oxa1 family membrane protein insertase [Clostridia bacterium]
MNLFDIINIPFAYIMRWFDSFTGSYALTLLLFTLVIKLVFVPLGIKQQKNQIKMAALRPKEEVIRKKYAGRTDQATMQKMQQEIVELQQKENVSPFGGCLPMVVQLVVIMAVYSIIRQPLTYICGLGQDTLIELANTLGLTYKGAEITAGNFAGFDQINAISVISANLETVLAQFPDMADALSHIPNLSFFGLNLGVTPMEVWSGFTSGEAVTGVGVPTLLNVIAYAIIPVGCFFLQVGTMKLTRKFTYQSPATQDAQTGCSMKIMDWTMPLMSLFFCFSFSSAIGLYWIYSNILSFVQTVLLSKLMPVPKVTDEQIKAAEKEMKAKGYDTKKANLPRVRSLHHIDDEDYEALPEIESEVKGASQTLLNGEKVPQKSNANKPKLKDESDKNKK